MLGDCPCGRGSIRTVSKDGSLLFFECGLKSVDLKPCHQRFHHRGGVDGQILCATDNDTTLHDFGRMVEENGVRYFESHLKGTDRGPRGLLP